MAEKVSSSLKKQPEGEKKKNKRGLSEYVQYQLEILLICMFLIGVAKPLGPGPYLDLAMMS